MPKPRAERVSERYMKQAAEKLPPVTAARLIDLVNFEVALSTYVQWIISQDRKSDPLLTEGKAILRKVFPAIKSGIQKYLGDVSKDAPGTIKATYKRAIMGRDIRAMPKQVNYFSDILPWLMKHQDIMKNVFGSQRAVMAARNVAGIVQEEGTESRLNKAAGIVPASKFKRGQKWIAKAAEAVGAGLTETEQVLADASYAKGLGIELQDIEAKLAQTDPNTPEAAELEAKRISILEQLENVAQDTPDKSVILAAAASAKMIEHDFATATGKHMDLSPDQEDAMMVQGRAIIAAGAGSGKTRVLAAKVAYHVKELGVPPSSILATSFTKKSSAELIKRIEEKAGVKLDKGDMSGFGTTHSIAWKLINTSARSFRRAGGYSKETWKQVTLLRLAIEQVQMPGGGENLAPEPVGFWEGKAVGGKSPGKTPADHSTSPDTDHPDPDVAMEAERLDAFQNAIDDARGYFRAPLRNPNVPGGVRRWAEKAMALLDKVADTDPQNLSPADKEALNRLFAKAQGSQYARVKNYRVAKKKHKLDDRKFFKTPAGQWFNLGRKLTRGPEGKKAPIPLGEFKNAISILKGKGITPSQAWAGEGGYGNASDHAAVYAAYEWLKGPTGEPEFQRSGDMDDLLIDTVTALVSSPKIRRQVQNRYKVVLVDEAQDLNRCVHGETEVQTPEGHVQVRNLQVGQKVASFVNGMVVYNKVQAKERSSWGRGYRIHLKSGKTLCMSPDHQIYAAPLTSIPQGQMALYLMYREGMGFRIGSSTRLFHPTQTSSGRAVQEQADCAWILEVGDTDEILYKEQALSLQYAVPTYIFEGTVRGCNQARINQIFKEFGENGRKLLARYDLDFHYPHWVSPTVTRGSKSRRVVNLYAHRNSGIQRGSKVSMSWSGDVYELDIPIYQVKGNRYMINKLSVDYGEARRAAQHVIDSTGARLVESLWLGDKKLPLITASALFPGMQVPVWEGSVDLERTDFRPIEEYKALAQKLGVNLEDVGGTRNTGKAEIHEFLRQEQLRQKHPSPIPPVQGSPVTLDEIEAVEMVFDGDYWDIAVQKAHNFFGGGVLSHNCQHNLFGLITGYLDPQTLEPSDNKEMTADTYTLIGDDKQAIYEFRGADPDEFIDKSDMTKGGDDFRTKLLETNYRSGAAIVNGAQRLIDHNSKQVPMVCKAKEDRNGTGQILTREAADVEEAAVSVAEDIADSMNMAGGGETKYQDFGVAVRSNAEAYDYGLEMLKRGIPFKSNARFFNDPNTKAIIGWMTIIEQGLDSRSPESLDALGNAVRAPYTGLGKKLKEVIAEKTPKDEGWGRWFVDGGFLTTYTGPKWGPRVEFYAQQVEKVSQWKGDPNQIVMNLLDLRGLDGNSTMMALADNVRENDDVMAQLAAESDSGIPSEDQIREMAMAPVKPLLGLTGSQENLTGAMQYIRKLQKVNEKITSADTDKEIDRDAVTIGTMHSWKGLECPNMFVPMVGGKFPRTAIRADMEGGMEQDDKAPEGPDLWSERRLAYVAITRAEQRCVLLDIPHPKFGTHSQFITETCAPIEEEPRGEGAVTKVGQEVYEILASWPEEF